LDANENHIFCRQRRNRQNTDSSRNRYPVNRDRQKSVIVSLDVAHSLSDIFDLEKKKKPKKKKADDENQGSITLTG
jgi:hypothetical protein